MTDKIEHPICFCSNCEREFAEAVTVCPDCGDDGDIRAIYYCPYCEVRMSYLEPVWESDVQECPECDACFGGDNYPASDAIDNVKEHLKHYGKRVNNHVKVLELALEKACKLQAYNSRMVKSPDNWKEGFLAQAQAELSEVK